MDDEKFLKDLETILEADPHSLKLNDRLADLAGWDSLAALSFLAMADANYNAKVKAADLAKCQTVADLSKLLTQT